MPADGVGRVGQRGELAVVVADVEDRDLVQPVAVQEVVQDRPAGVHRAGDAHQQRHRRRHVDRTEVLDGVLVLITPGPAITNVPCMLMLLARSTVFGR